MDVLNACKICAGNSFAGSGRKLILGGFKRPVHAGY
jgi:hypothetical protein